MNSESKSYAKVSHLSEFCPETPWEFFLDLSEKSSDCAESGSEIGSTSGRMTSESPAALQAASIFMCTGMNWGIVMRELNEKINK